MLLNPALLLDMQVAIMNRSIFVWLQATLNLPKESRSGYNDLYLRLQSYTSPLTHQCSGASRMRHSMGESGPKVSSG